MQNVINRLCPLVKPLLETRQGRTRARFREEVQIRKIVLVSTGGWWEKENFGTLRIVEELAADAGAEFAGAILRPHAFLVREEAGLTEDGQAVLQAVRRTGGELVREGAMSPDTLAAISRPLVSEDELRRRYNQAL